MSTAARQPVGRRVVPVEDLAGAYCVSMGAAGLLLSSPLARQDVLAALDGSIRAQQADGLPVRREVLDLAADLAALVAQDRRRAAEDFRLRQAALPEPAASASWTSAPQHMTVADAAAVLGVTARQVRALASAGALTARKAAGAWHLDAAAVLAAADNRREHHL
ncbi:hypothetical protein GCU67_08115 [Modestobacter muralis]|uniref:Helix-turn-helix domain-containing protein n=1 Tax=Modestobacter muralis TaxID=1608614 RepID=A0A6P0H7Z4_9ACTN|nr:helix-turn-helix domain-containing protein [Modestobacter muralis]NEK94139.1 hypothetical protein [Modestobacter muralis]NEN50906.1 hypothetical protein [Modestobacter muralis]